MPDISRSRRHRCAHLVVTALAVGLSLGFTFLDPAARKNRDGTRLFEKGDYAEALKRFQEAQLEKPQSPGLHYNVGSALYKQKAFKEAEKELVHAGTSQQGDLGARALYNLGNTLYREGRFQEAAEAYKRSLRLDPGDNDAKVNLELAQKQQQDQQQKQQQENKPSDQDQQKRNGQQQDPGQRGQDNQHDSQQQKQQNSQQQDQQEQQGQDSPEKRQQDQQQNQQESQQQDRQQSPDPHAPQDGQPKQGEPKQAENAQQPQGQPEGGLTQQEAERILEALRNRELQAQKHRRVRLTGRRYNGEKW